MASYNLLLLSALLALVASQAMASDPSPLQDFCVADMNKDSPVRVNGFPCKDADDVKPEDFFLAANLDKPMDTTKSKVGSNVTLINVMKLAGLNTLGISMARTAAAASHTNARPPQPPSPASYSCPLTPLPLTLQKRRAFKWKLSTSPSLWFLRSRLMGKRLAGAEKEVLVEIVRFTQKNGLKGAEGGWKEFLARNDKKFGASVSDPKKRSRDVLLVFLLTFSKDFQKYFSKLVKRHKERRTIEQCMKDFPDKISPEQKLVQLTAEHPEYRKNYNFPSYQEGWKVMRIGEVSNYMNLGATLALDCEMVLCHDGTEAVVRVCVVDNNLEVKLDKLVNPLKAIKDYRTDITAVSKKDLEGVTCSLVDVQKSLKKILSKGKILIGHSLSKDLHALKFDCARVIDTAYIFKYANLPSTASASLNSLCKSALGYSVREEGEPHNCLKDAEAAMNLVIAKLKHGFNDPIEVETNNVPESDLMKLLAHRIPVYLPCQELLKIFSGNPSIDEKIDSRIRGEFYSTCVSFKDVDEVEKAFEELDGQETKDSSGRLQKYVLLKRDNGDVASFYVRKMVYGSRLNVSEFSKKRTQPIEDVEPKKEDVDGDKQKKQRTSKKHVNKAKISVVE